MTAKRYDITGKKIDMVTVLKRTGTTKMGSAIWLCQCKCGKQFEITATNLNRKKFKSCGCITGNQKPSQKRLNLVGEKFGRLTVLEPQGVNKNQKTIWKCRCECGSILTVIGAGLKNGNSKSCGCYAKEAQTIAGKNNLINLSGMSFGRLTVIQKLENRNKRVYWLCKCNCGKEVPVMAKDLRSGKRKSCGCIFKEFKKENHPNWKGGKRKTLAGYITLSGYKDHPNANACGVIAEHRLIMSQKLNRPLDKNENVHHKNGIKDDNRLENLELWVKQQPVGQRVEDKIEYAINILSNYAPNLLNKEIVLTWNKDYQNWLDTE